jgi:CHAD domain-containing protein
VDRGKVGKRYARLSRKLGKRLGAADAEQDGREATFGAALAPVVRDELAEARERLAAVVGPDDEEHAHRARIAAKRVRYLLEPLRRDGGADAGAAVKRWKELQDLLGEMHDAHVLGRELGAALDDAGGRQAALRNGILAVEALVRERRRALFATLERDWRAGGFEALAGDVAALAERLERGPGAPALIAMRAPRARRASGTPPGRSAPRARRPRSRGRPDRAS